MTTPIAPLESADPTQPSYKDAKAQAKAAKAYAKAQRPFWKKKRAWALAGIAGIIAISVISNSGGGSDAPTADGGKDLSSQAVKEKAPKAMPVQAKAILAEFDENEAAADAKYDGKVLQVTGIVDKIDTEIFDDSEYVIQIGGGSEFEFFTVNADDQSQDAVASLKKGDKITVIGDFEDGGDLGVELAHSKIVG